MQPKQVSYFPHDLHDNLLVLTDVMYLQRYFHSP